jgi:hypothetical protein
MTDNLSLARFADEKKKLGPAGLVRLYTPPRLSETLSVFTATEAPEEDMLDAGKYVARERKKRHLYGWAILSGCAYKSLHLKVSIDGNPTFGKCLHANVTGWPNEQIEKIACAQKLVKFHKEFPVHKLAKRVDSGYSPNN